MKILTIAFCIFYLNLAKPVLLNYETIYIEKCLSFFILIKDL